MSMVKSRPELSAVMNCNSCGHELGEPFYRGCCDESITTMNTHIQGELHVFLCPVCGHCQTLPLNDLKSYYENDYELGRLNEEDDQLYAMSADGPIYRAQHQATVLLRKVKIDSQTKLLDFGCGKSLTMRRVCGLVDNFKPYVYDVTDKYLDLWLEITERECCAVNYVPESWNEAFDIITSFYALEHIEDLYSVCRKIRSMLRDSGYFYFIIPDMVTNPADFIVADHVNHFSRSSLSALMMRSGFEVEDIDHTSHYGAIICLAKKVDMPEVQNAEVIASANNDEIKIDDQFMQKAYSLAEFWSSQNERIVKAISNLPKDRGVAIYGAGFYGTYLFGIATQCGRNVECFIDSNPHMLGKENNGIPIVAPSGIPSNVEKILVGLNPSKAKSIIASIKDFDPSQYSFLYIE